MMRNKILFLPNLVMFLSEKKAAHRSIHQTGRALWLHKNPLIEKTGDSLFPKKLSGSEFFAQRFGRENLHELSTANIKLVAFYRRQPNLQWNDSFHEKGQNNDFNRLFRKRLFIYNPKIAKAQEKKSPFGEKRNGTARSKACPAPLTILQTIRFKTSAKYDILAAERIVSHICRRQGGKKTSSAKVALKASPTWLRLAESESTDSENSSHG